MQKVQSGLRFVPGCRKFRVDASTGWIAGGSAGVAVCMAIVMVFSLVPHASAALLYGVTGDGASTPETLYLFNQTDASATLVTALGYGGAGEAIGFNPNDGLIYHFSGNSAVENINTPTGSIMETIDPVTWTTTPVTLAPGGFNHYNMYTSTEINAVVPDISSNDLFVSARTDLYRVTTTGTPTWLGSLYDWASGMVFIGSTLYGIDNDNNPHTQANLRMISTIDGSSLGAVPITVDGIYVDKGLGLAFDPDTSTLWALIQDNNYERHLLTIDPLTGTGTHIGQLSDKFSSITFVTIPEPTSLLLLLGAGVPLAMRRPKRD